MLRSVLPCVACLAVCVGLDWAPLISRASAQSVEKSTVCEFTSGPRTGQTQDYAPMAALPIGTPCHDGAGSTGKVVAPKGNSSGAGGAAKKKSTLCEFTSGPRAGQTQDYAPMAALPIGTPCHDGAGSTGKVVAPKSKSGGAGGAAEQKSTLCEFTSGPRAGQTQDYAPMAALPIGTPCHDGAGSTGKVVAPKDTSGGAGAEQKSTLCEFTSGPRTGQTQDYAPMAALPIGTPCHDGAGSTGKVVASKGL
jgi:hypothetical protein